MLQCLEVTVTNVQKAFEMSLVTMTRTPGQAEFWLDAKVLKTDVHELAKMPLEISIFNVTVGVSQVDPPLSGGRNAKHPYMCNANLKLAGAWQFFRFKNGEDQEMIRKTLLKNLLVNIKGLPEATVLFSSYKLACWLLFLLKKGTQEELLGCKSRLIEFKKIQHNARFDLQMVWASELPDLQYINRSQSPLMETRQQCQDMDSVLN